MGVADCYVYYLIIIVCLVGTIFYIQVRFENNLLSSTTIIVIMLCILFVWWAQLACQLWVISTKYIAIKKTFERVSLGAFDVEKVLQHAVVRLVCYACHFSFLVCVEKFDFRFPEIFSIFG